MKSVSSNHHCKCKGFHETTKLVVLTGGPGAGKTAILELARKQLCEHVAIFPESASIIFKGGFWRLQSSSAKMASQRAIYYVQKEMEHLVLEEKNWGLGLCDRGTLDGLAYWPEEEKTFWNNLGTSKEKEFKKYSAVIHLRTPSVEFGYNHQNPIRIETAHEASIIDNRIYSIWKDHPCYQQVDSTLNFLEKAEKAMAMIMEQVPDCCR